MNLQPQVGQLAAEQNSPLACAIRQDNDLAISNLMGSIFPQFTVQVQTRENYQFGLGEEKRAKSITLEVAVGFKILNFFYALFAGLFGFGHHYFVDYSNEQITNDVRRAIGMIEADDQVQADQETRRGLTAIELAAAQGHELQINISEDFQDCEVIAIRNHTITGTYRFVSFIRTVGPVIERALGRQNG